MAYYAKVREDKNIEKFVWTEFLGHGYHLS